MWNVTRKFVALSVFVLVAALVDCAPSSTTAPTTAPAANTVAPAATAAPAAAKVCSGSGGVINVWSGGDTNITDWLANKVGPAFQKACPQYTVKVTTVRGIGNGITDIEQRALAALQTGSDPQAELFDEDPSGHPELVNAGLFQKLDASNIPNAKNVIKAAYLNDYTMAYRGSQVLLAYDSAKVKESEVPKTFMDLVNWVKAHPGQFVYCRPDKGGSGGNFLVRAIYEVTGKDPSLFKPVPANGTPDPALVAQFPKAYDLLRSIHDNIYDHGAYPAGNLPVLQLLANGSVSMASVWSDQSLQALSQGVLPPTVKLTQFQDLPMPGGYAPWSVPKNAKNLQGALDFINFMLTPEVQVSVVKDIGGFPAIPWSSLPADLQQQYTNVITTNVPYWPGGTWDAVARKGWYDNVATNIKQGS
jgi:putative spermidine/putrescine transport system substrate-binding protein